MFRKEFNFASKNVVATSNGASFLIIKRYVSTQVATSDVINELSELSQKQLKHQNAATNAFQIFHQLDKNQQNDPFVMTAMMRCLINTKCNRQAITLYTETFKQMKCNDDDINISFIKACINSSNYSKCQSLVNSYNQNDISKHSIALWTQLLNYFGKIGDMTSAKHIFECIPMSKKDIITINTMMKCLIYNHEHKAAIHLFEQYDLHPYLQPIAIHLDDISYNLFLKACIHIPDYEKGQKCIDSKLSNPNNHSIQLLNTMIAFYGKFGHVDKANDIFDNIPKDKLDIVSVGAMMQCLITNDLNKDAIALHEQFSKQPRTKIKHNDVSNLLFIKACTNINDLDRVKQFIDANIVNPNNHWIYFTNSLIDFFGKNRDLQRAVHIFQNIPNKERDAVSVNTMMRCFMNNDQNKKAIHLYDEYHGFHNYISHNLYIKACIVCGEYTKCRQLIDKIYEKVKNDKLTPHKLQLVNTMIDFYGHVGEVDTVQNVFDDLSDTEKDAISINVMMKAHINNLQPDKAIEIYQEYMDLHDETSNLLLIKACIEMKEFEQYKCLIDDVMNKICDYRQCSIEFVSMLIKYYGLIGNVECAKEIFDGIEDNQRDAVCNGAMMKCLIDNEQYKECIDLYQTNVDLLRYNDVANTLFIKACCNIYPRQYEQAQIVIDEVEKLNKKSTNTHYVNTKIDYFGKIGNVDAALNVFENISSKMKGSVSLNAMMSAYLNNNQNGKAIALYEAYAHSIQYDDTSNLLFIKACINMGDYKKCAHICDELQLADLCNHDRELVSTLIHYFGKSGNLDKAVAVFESISSNDQSVIEKSAMMNAYNDNEEYEAALSIFDAMKDKDVSSFSIALHACGHLMNVQKGLSIVNELNESGNECVCKHLQIEAAVINMFAKCSHFDEAIEKFKSVKENLNDASAEHDILCLYASMIDCYAKLGQIENVLNLLSELRSYGHVQVSNVIYCIVLNACSHSGSVEEAMNIFVVIKKERNKMEIHPNIINAVIDCFSRSGHSNNLDDAENVYLEFCDANDRIYYKFKLQMLLSLLSACRTNNDGNRSDRILALIQKIGQYHEIDESISETVRVLLAGIQKLS